MSDTRKSKGSSVRTPGESTFKYKNANKVQRGKNRVKRNKQAHRLATATPDFVPSSKIPASSYKPKTPSVTVDQKARAASVTHGNSYDPKPRKYQGKSLKEVVSKTAAPKQEKSSGSVADKFWQSAVKTYKKGVEGAVSLFSASPKPKPKRRVKATKASPKPKSLGTDDAKAMERQGLPTPGSKGEMRNKVAAATLDAKQSFNKAQRRSLKGEQGDSRTSMGAKIALGRKLRKERGGQEATSTKPAAAKPAAAKPRQNPHPDTSLAGKGPGPKKPATPGTKKEKTAPAMSEPRTVAPPPGFRAPPALLNQGADKPKTETGIEASFTSWMGKTFGSYSAKSGVEGTSSESTVSADRSGNVTRTYKKKKK